MSSEQDIQDEADAADRLKAAIAVIETDLHLYWHWGDGCGGFVLEQLADAVRRQGYLWPNDKWVPASPRPKKQRICRQLSRLVMERDAYRCVTCGTHINLSCDHIVAESKGGPTTLDNLQTMCRPCNSRKGNK